MTRSLTAKYLGMELQSPVIVGACPLAIKPEAVRQLVLAGASAIVLPSMLQEQIVYSRMRRLPDPLAAIEQSGYQPQQDKYNGGPVKYLETIRQLKSSYSIPIIASINGGSEGDWLDYAKETQASGADALEFNWQHGMSDPNESAAQVELRLCNCVDRLRKSLTIPVAVKLSQHFTNLASIVLKLKFAGADGVVLFSHRPQWDVSIDRMHWTIHWELSPINSVGMILEGIVRTRTAGLDIPIAASGGIRTGEDAIKTMIAGADVVMVTSEIYRQGPDAIRNIIEGISRYLDSSHYGSLLEFQQSRPEVKLTSQRQVRLEYVDPLTQSNHFYDPTPVASVANGDLYGHRLP